MDRKRDGIYNIIKYIGYTIIYKYNIYYYYLLLIVVVYVVVVKRCHGPSED